MIRDETITIRDDTRTGLHERMNFPTRLFVTTLWSFVFVLFFGLRGLTLGLDMAWAWHGHALLDHEDEVPSWPLGKKFFAVFWNGFHRCWVTPFLGAFLSPSPIPTPHSTRKLGSTGCEMGHWTNSSSYERACPQTTNYGFFGRVSAWCVVVGRWSLAFGLWV